MSKIYALVNQKGGVGKTTTAINLGAYLATMGQRVLLVDIDPQANTTSCLGIDKRTVAGGTYELLIDPHALIKANILLSPKLKLWLLPSSEALAGAEIELVQVETRHAQLQRALEAVQDEYDYILIDCPPSLGLLTLNALVAAEAVIIPVQCEYLALEGLGQLLQTVDRVRNAYRPDLDIRGVVLTMYDTRTILSRDVVAEVRRHFSERVFKSVIPRSIRLAEAPSYGIPISVYAPNSSGGKAYAELARELLAADKMAEPVSS